MSQARKLKTPRISDKTRLLSFDLESNGLHGEVFAAAGVVVGADGAVYSEFSGRCPAENANDEWVEKNVIPAITGMPVNFKNTAALREAFWAWFVKAEQQAAYTIVSNGYPVEFRFLLKCQEENLAERYWQHPYPVLDLFSLLLMAGQIPENTNRLKNKILKEHGLSQHHPLHDAKVTALTAFKLFEMTGL